MIQESAPAYASMPSAVLQNVTKLADDAGTGLTGPAEAFNMAVHGGYHDEDEVALPSIFQGVDTFGANGERPLQPDELPPDASATEVILAWASRLQDVYNQCVPSYHKKEEGRLQVD